MSAYEINILQEIRQVPLAGRMIHSPVPPECPYITNPMVLNPHLSIHKGISGTIARCFLCVAR